jgi:hypothetical protein
LGDDAVAEQEALSATYRNIAHDNVGSRARLHTQNIARANGRVHACAQDANGHSIPIGQYAPDAERGQDETGGTAWHGGVADVRTRHGLFVRDRYPAVNHRWRIPEDRLWF